MMAIRPIMRTLVALPLAFSSCIAKNANEFTSTAATIVQKTQLKSDVFQKTATKAVSEVANSHLPIKSATHMHSRTALTVEQLDNAIEELIKPKSKKHSRNALRGKGKVFMEMGEKYEVNPASILAIAMTESGRGVSSPALIKNNVGGLTGRKGLIKYSSVDDCIEAMAKLLQKHIKILGEIRKSNHFFD